MSSRFLGNPTMAIAQYVRTTTTIILQQQQQQQQRQQQQQMPTNRILHLANEAAWWYGENALFFFYWFLKLRNPWMPNWYLWLESQALLKLSDVVNHRFLLEWPLDKVSRLATWSVGDHFNSEEERKRTELFFRLGVEGLGRHMGSGTTSNPDNCFFPESLAGGPTLVTSSTPPMTEKRNVEIAKSCALLSLLSYRHDDIIVKCMTDHGMLPGTSFFSIHTIEECDLSIFVADDESFCVVVFRGTEPETARDWLTSALLCEPTTFYTGFIVDPNEAVTNDQVPKVRARYYRQMKHASRKQDLKFHTGHFLPSAPDATISAFELLLYLQMRGNCNTYYTGHSLGGGLATLMGADMLVWTDEAPAGIVTFGSPPVGDKTFCTWYNEHFNHRNHRQSPVSWRFVHEDEFAAMAPPLPYTRPNISREFHHVEQFLPVQSLLQSPLIPTPSARSYDAMDERMTDLACKKQLSKVFLDHNLATTIQELHKL